MSYSSSSRHVARVFTLHAVALRNISPMENTLSKESCPRYRRLADRYRKAAIYLYSRVGRNDEPTYELINDNDPF